MTLAPLRALRSIFCTKSLCDCGQYQLERSAQPSTMSPTREMGAACGLLKKSSNCSACEPRAPRWTSEINKVRKRRSGLSSLEESLPMPVHLPDSCDKAMTIHATDDRKSMTRISGTPHHGVTARCDI